MDNVFIEFFVVSKVKTREYLALTKWFIRVADKMPAEQYAELRVFISFESLDYVFLN